MPRTKLIVPKDAEVEILIKPRPDGRNEIIVNASDGKKARHTAALGKAATCEAVSPAARS